MLETQVASGHPILERLPRTDSRATLEIAVVLRCVLFVALSAARVLQAASWSCVLGSFRAKVPGGNLLRRRYGVTTKKTGAKGPVVRHRRKSRRETASEISTTSLPKRKGTIRHRADELLPRRRRRVRFERRVADAPDRRQIIRRRQHVHFVGAVQVGQAVDAFINSEVFRGCRVQ